MLIYFSNPGRAGASIATALALAAGLVLPNAFSRDDDMRRAACHRGDIIPLRKDVTQKKRWQQSGKVTP